MTPELASRGIAAATSVAVALELRVDDAVVIQSSNQLALRLLPCDVFARVAQLGREVAALELELAQQLADLESPVAALDPRVQPRVYADDGFAVTLWTYYETVTPDEVAPADYANALHRLHSAMRSVEIAAPHFTDRATEAVRLVANREQTPGLDEADRRLLLTTLHEARGQIHGARPAEQVLHGEPHPGNLLSTQGGPVFIDLETCCRGPIEFDVAHAPDEVGAHYPDVDQVLLDQCRRLVLAMVGA
ncbi:MAG: phosphotransferase, partial [Actinomycetes bacterium]